MAIIIDNQEILTVKTGVKWSGAIDKATRTLEFTFLYYPKAEGEPVDIPQYKVKAGSKVQWIDENNKILFLGYVENLSYSTDEEEMHLKCVDLASYLASSKCVGRFRGTLKEIADNICASFGLKNGIITDDRHNHNIVSTGDKTYFEILYIAGESIFGKDKFAFYMDNMTLKLAEKEVQKIFEIKKNIRKAEFEQSIKDLKTKVLILDNNGKLISSEEDKQAINEFGLFQEIYNWNKDCKDNKKEANQLLKKPENISKIVCDNDNNCISGRYVKIINPILNQSEVFLIKTDEHTINADSEMTLELSLKEE